MKKKKIIKTSKISRKKKAQKEVAQKEAEQIASAKPFPETEVPMPIIKSGLAKSRKVTNNWNPTRMGSRYEAK